MDKRNIIRAASSSPFWALMTHEEKLEYLEEFEILHSETRLPSASEVIRFGEIADYI